MCAGCETSGVSASSIVTRVRSPSFALKVASPDWPEPLCSTRSTLIDPSGFSRLPPFSSPPQPVASRTLRAKSAGIDDLELRALDPIQGAQVVGSLASGSDPRLGRGGCSAKAGRVRLAYRALCRLRSASTHTDRLAADRHQRIGLRIRCGGQHRLPRRARRHWWSVGILARSAARNRRAHPAWPSRSSPGGSTPVSASGCCRRRRLPARTRELPVLGCEGCVRVRLLLGGPTSRRALHDSVIDRLSFSTKGSASPQRGGHSSRRTQRQR
jgi:hypothetical protein